jgi:hypothetical protein
VRSTDHEAPHYEVFSTPPVTWSLLGPNTLLNTPFSNTLSLRSSASKFHTHTKQQAKL